MKKLMVATSNQHKVMEFKEIFELFGLTDIELVCPKDFNDDSEPIEDGNSFFDNSLIKAKFYFDKYHMPTLADDSGISIDYFDGKPGIYSARFLPGMNYAEKNEYIVNELKGSDNRGAQFTCVVTYIEENGTVHQYEGIVEGTIAQKPEGNGGFGYDPIFVPNGQDKCVGLLGQDFKNHYSHRSIALKKFVDEYKK